MILQTIIGGNGTIGKEVAKQLHDMNIQVRIASRTPKKVNANDQVFAIDVFNEQSVSEAIKGSSVVYPILGLPYKDQVWLDGFPRAARAVINACKKEGAKLVYFEVYGIKGTSRRDALEREFESFEIGLLLKKAREDKHLTQEQLAELVDKKRTYISRIENDGSNMTLKTLFEIVEKGLGGKVKISIQI